MSFETDLNSVFGAIIELVPQMNLNPPDLAYNQMGQVVTTYCGNGRWHRSSTYYFNCGVNDQVNTAPAVGEKGHLGKQEGLNVQLWFQQEYPNDHPNVLKDGTKWNYTLVRNHRAFNFHLLVG